MSILKHEFTQVIIEILDQETQGHGEKTLNLNEILQYLNIKTKSANTGSKSRPNLANLYAIYVLIEDYLTGNFNKTDNYADYAGAKFSDLLKRQRELPFGEKLQNHALNSRLNEDFKKYFPNCEYLPVIRDIETKKYWINEQLIIVENFNLAESIIKIIDDYVEVRKTSFENFMANCYELISIQKQSPDKVIQFIKALFNPNTDARIFEIASFAVLKQYYAGQLIYWGWSPERLNEESLMLYKTGRTNANDGGIDFVMKPLGRFFQVTETIDAGKYFLDIDKVQRYPITFVVKTNESSDEVLAKITRQAEKKYQIKAIVEKYIQSIEEVINIPRLLDIFEHVLAIGKGADVIQEIILQSRVEFNLDIDEQTISNIDDEANENNAW